MNKESENNFYKNLYNRLGLKATKTKTDYQPISESVRKLLINHSEILKATSNFAIPNTLLRTIESDNVQVISSKLISLSSSPTFQSYLEQAKTININIERILEAEQIFKNSTISQILDEISESLLNKVNNEWVDNLIKSNAIVSGYNYSISILKEAAELRQAYTLQLDEGVETADGTFHGHYIVNGKVCRVITKPVEKEVNNNAVTSVVLQNENMAIAIQSNFEKPSNFDQNIKRTLTYDFKSSTIFVGEFSITIKPDGFVDRCMSEITKTKTNLKQKWYFLDLINALDWAELDLKNREKKIKSGYFAFLHIQKKLPIEINDLFILKNKSVSINQKYLK